MKKLLIITMLFFYKINAFTISESGEFTLGGDIVEAGDVITIAVSNVIVNLDNNIVSGGTTGIRVNTGLSNIVIKNGTIDSNAIGISIESECFNITLQNLEITNCTDRAIEVLAFLSREIIGLTMQNVKIEQCSTGVSADHVITFSFTDQIVMEQVMISRNGGASVPLRAINATGCDKANCSNINIVCNQGSTFQGVRIENSTGFLFINSNIRLNTATGDLAGFRLFGGVNTNGNIIQDCIVSNNTSTSGPLAAYELLPFVIRNILRNCLASTNLTTGAVATANCYGFNCNQPTFCSVIDCRANENRATGNGTTNICAGFNIGTSAGGTTGTKNCEFFGNKAYANNAFNDARSFGFRVVSAANGNTGNVYTLNIGMLNGPSTPTIGNQITSTSGADSSAGGVENGSVRNRNTGNLNSNFQYSNVRIIQ